MTSKVLAIAAAILLVGAFALATLGPVNMTLGQLLVGADIDIVRFLHDGIRAAHVPWLWDHVVLPMLVRPAWLLPAALGLVCVGVAATFGSNGAPRGQRRRS
jgi:hypothetical protein